MSFSLLDPQYDPTVRGVDIGHRRFPGRQGQIPFVDRQGPRKLQQSGITVVIAAHVPRIDDGMLNRAIGSVWAQTLLPDAMSIAIDSSHSGAAVTRQRALDMVQTPWTAFLDSDDEFRPHHLETVLNFANEHGADYVFPWYDKIGGGDPYDDGRFGKPFDPEHPIETTITFLVKTKLAQEVRFKQAPHTESGPVMSAGEDRMFTLGCIEAGAKIMHCPQRTWIWHDHGKNTGGLGQRW